ncbi:MAG: hypothetical protein IT379_14740 [Deltaproteobacteria bacterium]|nr:hypothetical protein [Deltaproteobacteria bacterium]
MASTLKKLSVAVFVLALPWIVLYCLGLGLVSVWRAAATLWRLPRALRNTVRCPLGHPVETASFWRCQCGAAIAGYAFTRCPHCGEAAGRIDVCPTCGLSIRNPVLP